jgi:hypothetical protein
MSIYRKDNVILREADSKKAKELEVLGFEKVTEDDLKPKAKRKQQQQGGNDKKD